ncbi:MAG: tetratricopeptide repeat protein [Acidobacteria bacterium]|nr:tetratricopeptide repeat protein [Acidobacteriota bacterium]
MVRMVFTRVMLLAAFAIGFSASALAQTGPIEGTVKLKGADGVVKPLEGAIVMIYRTDISGKWDVKTDKNGHYVRLGMPIAGTFIVVFSGPGAQPSFIPNVRLVQSPVVDMTLEAGDGSTLTLEQVKAALAKPKGGATTSTPTPQMSAADKAKAEKADAEYQKQLKESKEVQANFDQARTRYNTGIGLMQAKNYAAALTEFEAASGVETTKHVEFLRLAYKADANIAEAHYQMGVDLFNKKQRPEAKEHLDKAVASVSKAIELASTDTAEPNINNDLIIYYGMYGKNMLLLVEHYSETTKLAEAAAFMDKAAAIDATNKTKWLIMKGDMYRFGGMQDEAVATYKAVLEADPKHADALYKLGLTFLASAEKEKLQQAANYLDAFIAAAPPDDKRIPEAKSSLQVLKNEFKVEAEKSTKRKTGRP